MASIFDALLKTSTKHAVAGSTDLLGTTGGKHIRDIQVAADIDNGCIIGKGEYVAPMYFKETTPTSFAGVVLGQAANGNWYVEVTEADNAFLVLQAPVIYESNIAAFAAESNFYNAKDDIVRCYELAVNDIFEVSAEAFDGTPEAKKTVSVESKKLKIAVD